MSIEKFYKLIKNLKLFWFYRELLINLAKREISARYKQSILGYAWVIINPLTQLAVLSFVFSSILKVPSLGVPYIVFLSVALLPWNLFQSSLTSSSGVLVQNSSLITKIYFPREILVYSTIIAKIIDFLFSLVILAILIAIFGVPIYWSILWVPLIFVIQIIFTIGISLFVSAFNLFYRDIQYLLTLFLLVWFYLTPIAYPIEAIPQKFQFIMSLNPMAVIINAYREVIISGGNPNITSLLTGLVISLVIFAVSFLMFKKLERSFADYV